MATPIEDLYENHIKHLPQAERMQLLELISLEITRASDEQPLSLLNVTAKLEAEAAIASARSSTRKRDIMELHGLGSEIWKGKDAQEYVNELRGEWDSRP